MKWNFYDAIPLVIYILLATGTVFPLYVFGTLFPLHTAFLCLFLIPILKYPGAKHSLVIACLSITPFLVVYLVSSIRTDDLPLVMERLEGAFFTTIVVASLVSVFIIKTSEVSFQRAFLLVATSILVLTILYKAQVGFFDRGQRFFLNGPIVFGWLMGFAALTTLIQLVERKISPLMGLCMVSAFLCALLWTSSKGPIVAILVTSIFVLLSNIKSKRVYLYLGLTVLLLILLASLLPEDVIQRYSTLLRILTASTEQTDFGSVGIRISLLEEARSMFFEAPLFGVGVGNWQFNTPLGELVYPHNMTMEIAAEIGILGLLIFLGSVGVVFVKSAKWMRLSIVFFLICTSFSGDFAYYRFVVAFPIGLIAARSYAKIIAGKEESIRIA